MNRIHFLFLLCSMLHLSAGAENLLKGDPGVETESKYMTRGTWTDLSLDGRRIFRENRVAYEGRWSLRVLGRTEVSAYETGPLPKGKYVFSFYARADKDPVQGYISCSRFTRSFWRSREKIRKKILLGKEWKRFSYVFEGDGITEFVPEFGVSRSGDQAYFDAFQLEKGTVPTVWKQPEGTAGLTLITRQQGNIFHPDEKILFQAAVRVKDPALQYTLRLSAADWENKEVFVKEFPVKAGKDGSYAVRVEIPNKTRGYFRVDCRLIRDKQCEASDFSTLVIVGKPQKIAPGFEPFGGAAGGKPLYEAMRRMGVGWIEWVMDWGIVERKKGQYDYRWLIRYDRMKEMKKKGFFNKILYTVRAPDWEYLKEEAVLAEKLKLGLFRFPFSPEALPRWRAFVADSMKRYGQYMDLIEVGGELDAMFGCNTFFKKKYPESVRGNFVYGVPLQRYAEIFHAAADEILKHRAGIRLSSVRPSDVDSRHRYAYTEAVLKKTGKRVNWLGLDCYPQPRWIGPGQPPSGHAALMLGGNVAQARSIMERNSKGNSVFVSEYGYFIDYRARHELKYQREQANRLATSLIAARANGAKSFFWHMIFANGSNLHEANRYLMSITDREEPFVAVAAFSTAVSNLTNVTSVKSIKLADDLEICVFRKYDGSASAAVWSTNPEYTPQVQVEVTTLQVTDMVGKVLDLKKGWKLSEDPCYFLRAVKGEDNFARLCRIMENMQIREKLPVTIDVRQSYRNELRVIMSNKSRTKARQVRITDGAKNTSMTIPPGDFRQYRTKCTGEKKELLLAFKGYEPYRLICGKSSIFKIPRVRSAKELSSFGTLRIRTGDHIEPVDYTAWSDAEDLSVELKVAHDGKNLYFNAFVTDDFHFNKFTGNMLWKGDSMQLALDPRTNSFGKLRFNPDDYLMTFALTGKQTQWVIHEGPNLLSLKKYASVRITRDEKKRQTIYSLILPLRYIDRVLLKPRRVFGMNMVFFDDDSGSGADYWMFLTRGLTGKKDCGLYQLFELE